MSKIPYAKTVGCLMYSMVCTRPDLAHSISAVSRYMATPGKAHWHAVKWFLRYVKGRLHKGLMFGQSDNATDIVVGYVDSDFAGSIDTRKSQIGYALTIYWTAVSWRASHGEW
ncbi:unnamed protein product [Rhodiola kirilowii]